ncbi:MAG TPA: hypothetical protein VEY95_15685 [Azospirillaceae bacterium]|nr:hypothetical protein [Azospirillaceae bacterium]
MRLLFRTTASFLFAFPVAGPAAAKNLTVIAANLPPMMDEKGQGRGVDILREAFECAGGLSGKSLGDGLIFAEYNRQLAKRAKSGASLPFDPAQPVTFTAIFPPNRFGAGFRDASLKPGFEGNASPGWRPRGASRPSTRPIPTSTATPWATNTSPTEPPESQPSSARPRRHGCARSGYRVSGPCVTRYSTRDSSSAA